MTFIDWVILFLYLIFSFVLGIYLSLKNLNETDYFVAGRRLNGLLAGMSMAATTFSIDTPLYVAGIVGSRGLAGNWEGWRMGWRRGRWGSEGAGAACELNGGLKGG